MNRADILSLSRHLLDKHQLVNWKVRFVKAHSYAGMCRRSFWHTDPKLSRGVIDLSGEFFDVFSNEDILDTILHEIAHALTKPETRVTRTGRIQQVHHGKAWRETALRIGCTGMRCVSPESAKPKAKYRGVCPNGHETSAQRLTWNAKHNRSCHKCSSRFNPRFMFDWYEGETKVHAQNTPETPVTVKQLVLSGR